MGWQVDLGFLEKGSDDELTIDTCIAEALNEPYAGWDGKLLSAFWRRENRAVLAAVNACQLWQTTQRDGVRDMCSSEESFNA
ncbi:unnamed protein product [Effrenium voratum]|nr:unnamed protein product [Effrenium voratum]